MGIYIVGMHRSGTSALARFVGLLTGFEGPAHAGPHNVAGHWENPRMNFALDRVLRAEESDWASPPIDPIDNSATSFSLHAEAIGRILENLGSGPWVLKDPRLCLTLDAVLSLPQDPPAIIAAYRNPIEVAGSLKRRDGLPMHYGLALWECYARCTLLQLATLRSEWHLTSYDALMSAPEELGATLRTYLERQGYHTKPHSLPAALRSVRSELKHESAVDLSALNEAQLSLYHRLQSLERGACLASSDIPPLDSRSADFIDTRRPYGRMARDLQVLRSRTKRFAPLFRTFDRVQAKRGRAVPDDPWS